MKVIDTLWFTNINGTVGIVTIEEDVTGDRKAYISVVPGEDEKADTETIIAWGNKFSLDTLKQIEHSLKRGKCTNYVNDCK